MVRCVQRRSMLIGAASVVALVPFASVFAQTIQVIANFPATFVTKEVAALGELLRDAEVFASRNLSGRAVLEALALRLPDWRSDDVRDRIEALVREDFREGRMVQVHGWRLAETEALIAVAAFENFNRYSNRTRGIA